MSKNLLLISNSTMAGEAYLGWPREHIKKFLENFPVKKVLFVPYAGVGLSPESLEASFDAYEKKVAAVYAELGYEIESIHRKNDPVAAVNEAEAVAVGGGNTFHLVHMMHKTKIMEAIRQRCLDGMPYMGWSAGSNVACPALKTTNDMPIVEPSSFRCLNLISFQINPHYLDANPEGHGGETRQQRIEEYLVVNRHMTVVGLREGGLLIVNGDKLTLKGKHSMRLFRFGETPRELETTDDLSFLMKQ